MNFDLEQALINISRYYRHSSSLSAILSPLSETTAPLSKTTAPNLKTQFYPSLKELCHGPKSKEKSSR
jgi:hypothetical protein